MVFVMMATESAHRIPLPALCLAAAAVAKSLQLTLCNPIDSSPPSSPVPGILQARTLEWVAISSPMQQSEKWKEVSQSCQTLSDPMDCSFPGSSIHGIFQARVLEWGAIAFSSLCLQFSSVQSLSRVQLFETPWIAARQASLSITNSRPLSSQWCHPAISSSVVPFTSFPQSLPASESFPVSQLFTWGGQSTEWYQKAEQIQALILMKRGFPWMPLPGLRTGDLLSGWLKKPKSSEASRLQAFFSYVF